jgi:urea transport system permease protein
VFRTVSLPGVFLLILSLSLFSSACAAATPYDNQDIQALLDQLSRASISKAADVLDQLEQTGGDDMLPLFKAMLEGQLYYRNSDRYLVRLDKAEGGASRIRDLFSGATIDATSASDYSKVKVNNTLRVHLRAAMARIQLNSANPQLRLAAIDVLLGGVDAGSLQLLQDRLLVENDAEIKEALEQDLALYRLQTSEEVEVRVAALHTLSGSLNPVVRSELARLLEKNADGSDAEPDAAVREAAAAALKSIQGRLTFYALIEQLFFGLSLGSVLLLAAIGLSITFGVMGVINMAHGEMMMLGAYTTYVVQLLMPNSIDYSLWVAIPAAFLVSGLVGVVIERGVIRYLHGRPLETLLATFGISLILQQTVRSIFSPLNRQVATPEWMSGSLQFNSVLSITYNRLYILLFALLVFVILQLVLKKTSLGLNVRAVSQNRSMARAMGIRTEWVDAMTFGLGSGIAGVAGVALSQLTNVGPNLGQSYIIDSFMVVVFGGVGNLLGTLVGGFTLGVANKFLEPATGAVLANILILIFIILFIQKRPRGLFPQKGRAAND